MWEANHSSYKELNIIARHNNYQSILHGHIKSTATDVFIIQVLYNIWSSAVRTLSKVLLILHHNHIIATVQRVI